MTDPFIREILIEKNREFRQLYLRHQYFERTLETLPEEMLKTDEGLRQAQQLKKKKLHLKDAMQRLIIEYRKKVG